MIDERAELPRALRVQAWDAIDGLVHGFLGRHAGASEGAWSSLNLSTNVGDDPAAVVRNWDRVATWSGGLAIARVRQVHGDGIVHVEEIRADAVEADAMITRRRGIGLAILTADCVPILMIAPRARVAMAVHAGWRGTLAGIAARAVSEGERLYGVPSGEWHVALGPSIGGCCYQVSSEIGVDLERRWGSMGEAWHPEGERGMLDLRMANRTILIANGVAAEGIVEVGPCTACHDSEFFSHRRAGGVTGRQASIVGWK